MMKTASMRVLAAGNLFSNQPVLQLALFDHEAQLRVPLSAARLILKAMPVQREETLDFQAWKALHDRQDSIRAALVVEALALLIQRAVNIPVSFSATAAGIAACESHAIFEIENTDAGLQAGEIAVRLLTELASSDAGRVRRAFEKEFAAYVKSTAGTIPEAETLDIAKRARRRGIPWTSLPNCTFIQLGHGRYKTVMSASESSYSSSMASKLAKRKQITNPMLAAVGLPMAIQRTARTLNEALVAARWIGFPVVVKPAEGKKGKGVTVGVADDAQMGSAFKSAQAVSRRVVVESLIPGDEYRILVIDGQFRAAAMRRPAHVKGDGRSTIRQLIERENRNPERQFGAHTNLYPLVADREAQTCLSEQGVSLDTVLEPGRVAFLRRVSNISQGGDTVDVTDSVHPSVREIAERAATILGIDVCGVDYITKDISRPHGEVGGAICEVNSRPGLSVHMVVSEGTPRDMAAAVLERFFPDGAPSRVRVVAISGDCDEKSVQRAIVALAARKGRHVGIVAPGPGGIRGSHVPCASHLEQIGAITMDGDLEAAVVVVPPHDIVRFGLGLDHVDLAIVPAGEASARSEAARGILDRVSGGNLIASDDPQLIDRVRNALKPALARHGKADVRETARPQTFPVARTSAPTDMRGRSDTAEFTALLVGDIGFGEPYFGHPRALELKQLYATGGYGSSLRRVSDLLAAADLRIGNLEVPLAPAPDPILQGYKKYLGWSDPDETVRALVKARFDAVSLANNHSLDGGEQGLRSTIQKLHEAGIASFGADMNQAAASQPFMKTVRIGASERTIVVFGCFEHRSKYERQYKWYAGPDRPGVNPILPEIIAAQIKALRVAVPSPFFIVYPHWGTDYLDVQQNQREYARQLVSAGADLIVGHGAHVLQGVEQVAGRLVVYGLGNFVWNSPGRYTKLQATPYSLAAVVCFRCVEDRETLSLRLYPLLTDNAVTKFQSRRVSAVEFPDALAALTRNLDGLTGKAGLHEDPRGSYLEIPVDAVR